MVRFLVLVLALVLMLTLALAMALAVPHGRRRRAFGADAAVVGHRRPRSWVGSYTTDGGWRRKKRSYLVVRLGGQWRNFLEMGSQRRRHGRLRSRRLVVVVVVLTVVGGGVFGVARGCVDC